MNTPAFWFAPHPTLLARLLQPVSWLYQIASTLHRGLRSRNPYRAPVPIISVGNLTVGGGGKTPLVRLLAEAFQTSHTVAIVSRGYGGNDHGPTRVTSAHTVTQVGDESLLLARTLPKTAVWVSRNRPLGVQAAIAAGANLIVLDDAFTRTDIIRDIDILTFGPQGIGNGLTLPAGPLREPLSHACRVTLMVMQETPLPQGLPPKPTFTFLRHICPSTVQRLHNTKQPLVACAGLANPQPFFHQLIHAGLPVVATLPLPDHHHFPPHTLHRITNLLHQHNAHLVCTEKDSPKLPKNIPHTAVPLKLEGPTDDLITYIHQHLNSHASSNTTSIP